MNPADRYLADKVLTATPAQLTGMLFDGAVAALRGAVRLMDEGQWRAGTARSMKAQRILVELRDSLDQDAGGELARNLDALYEWAYRTLINATTANDVQAVRDVLAVVESLASTWREALLQSGARAA